MMTTNPNLMAKLNELYALAADRAAGVSIDPDTQEVTLSETDKTGASVTRSIGSNISAAVNRLKDEKTAMSEQATS